MKLTCSAALLHLLAAASLGAQQRPALRIAGDTAGSPRGCSGADAVASIAGWFDAFSAADLPALARATAKRTHFGVFSSFRFTATERTRIESVPRLLAYARERSRYHDRMTLYGVHFYGWHGQRLGFMPFYQRSAMDFGPVPIAGVGKAVYLCGQGVSRLNLAPRPPNLPGEP